MTDKNIVSQSPARAVRKVPPRPRRGNRRKPPTEPLFDDINTAAAKLGLDPEALRARCRRVQTKERGEVVARLGAGVVGYKLGRSWMFRFFAP